MKIITCDGSYQRRSCCASDLNTRLICGNCNYNHSLKTDKKPSEVNKMEKSYKDFCPSAKKGCTKYGSLSSKAMRAYSEKYRKTKRRNPNSIDNKESFYSFVARSKIR